MAGHCPKKCSTVSSQFLCVGSVIEMFVEATVFSYHVEDRSVALLVLSVVAIEFA